jgi:hypothetical protein
MPNKRSDNIANMEKEETLLNSDGSKKQPPYHSPWSTGYGPCPESESLDLHRNPNRGKYNHGNNDT